MAETVKPVKAWAVLDGDGGLHAGLLHSDYDGAEFLAWSVGLPKKIIPVLITPIEEPARDA